MPSSAALDRSEPMQIPAFWSRFLWLVGIGKAAIAGAGVALAALGALDVAFAITAQEIMREIKPHYLDIAAIGGGLVGAIVRVFIR
jgi:hypothetical protein